MNINQLFNEISRIYGKQYIKYEINFHEVFIIFRLIFGEHEAMNVKVWLHDNKATVWKDSIYINDAIMADEFQPNFWKFKRTLTPCKIDELVGSFDVEFDKKTLAYVKAELIHKMTIYYHYVAKDRKKNVRIYDSWLDRLVELARTRDALNNVFPIKEDKDYAI